MPANFAISHSAQVLFILRLWKCYKIFFLENSFKISIDYYPFYVLATNYTCFDGYFCSSLYGKAIRGDKDLLAISCSMDPNCTAFRYNPKKKIGFKCTHFDPKHTSEAFGHYQEDEWKLCEFDSGKGISDII